MTDEDLREAFEELLKRRRHTQDMNFIVEFTGSRGSGMSYSAIATAHYFDKMFEAGKDA